MNERVRDFLLILGMTVTILGGYYGFSMIQAHRAMDEALLAIVKGQARGAAEEKQ